jgi:MFS family permease
LRHPILLIPYLLLAGISGAAPVALVPMVLAETLGLKRFGTLFGWIGMMMTMGIFIGPIVVGKLYDLSGSYANGYIVCIIISLIGAAASFACSAPRAVFKSSSGTPEELPSALGAMPGSPR